MKKGKRSYAGGVQSGRRADCRLRAHLLSQAKTKASVQSSCSILKWCLLEPGVAAKWSLIPIQVAWLVPSCCSFQAPALPRAMWLLGPQGRVFPDERVREYTMQRIISWAREKKRLPPGGRVAHGENRRMHHMSSGHEPGRARDLSLSPGIIFLGVWDGAGAFSK